jgi:tetratricopeptide (TPR) repeat protein
MKLQSQAYEAMQHKDWHGAEQYYQRLYMRDSNNVKIRYRYAEASRLNFNHDVAMRLYNKIISDDNGKKYPLTIYWMGELSKYKGRYKEAKKWFQKFSRLNLKKKQYSYYNQKAKVQAESCDLAQILISNPVPASQEKLNASVNTIHSEFAPAGNDSNLFFSAIREPANKDGKPVYGKIYKYSAGKKNIAEMDTMINAASFHNANACFNPLTKEILFSRCISRNASEYNCEIFKSSFRNNRWQYAEKLSEPLNIPGYSTTQPNHGYVNGEKALFFASNRPGGFGGMDIWYSKITSEGGYSQPENAGASINTLDDETAPFYDSINSILFFSSTWHKGMGGFDIFRSKIANGVFSEPENAGYPINSSYNDLYFTISEQGNFYLASNRPSPGSNLPLSCCSDIYKFTPDKTKPENIIDSTLITREKLKLLVPLTLYILRSRIRLIIMKI